MRAGTGAGVRCRPQTPHLADSVTWLSCIVDWLWEAVRNPRSAPSTGPAGGCGPGARRNGGCSVVGERGGEHAHLARESGSRPLSFHIVPLTRREGERIFRIE